MGLLVSYFLYIINMCGDAGTSNIYHHKGLQFQIVEAFCQYPLSNKPFNSESSMRLEQSPSNAESLNSFKNMIDT